MTDRAKQVGLFGYSLIRPLADPALSPAELMVRVARAEERGRADERDVRLLPRWTGWPRPAQCFGLRGVRLGLVVPGLFAV